MNWQRRNGNWWAAAWLLFLPMVAYAGVNIYGGTNTIVRPAPEPEIGFAEIRTWNRQASTTTIFPFAPASTTVIIGTSETTTPLSILEVDGLVVFRDEVRMTSTSATLQTLHTSGTAQFTNVLIYAGATTTNLAVTGLNAASCDVKSDSNGTLTCGTDASGGGGGNGAWETIYGNTLRPTSTGNGIQVNASSTIFNLRVETLVASTSIALPNDSLLEPYFKAVDAAADEECLTFETTTGDFEWQTCGSGSGAAGQNGTWEQIAANVLAPTSTTAGINVWASSTLRSLKLEGELIGISAARLPTLNATSSQIGTLTVYTGSTFPADDIQDSEVSNTLTCSAFGTDPADCSANQFANAIGTTGALTCAAIADADIPDTITVSNYLSLANWFATTTWAGDNDLIVAGAARLPMANSTTTNVGTLLVYTGSTFPADDIVDAEVSDTLTASTFAANPANCPANQYPLGIDATGAVESCTADASGGGGGNGAWEQIGTAFLRPTNTTIGLMLAAASTTIPNLRVPDWLGATTTGIGTLTVFGDLNMDSGSITNYFGVGCSAGNNFVQDIADTGAFTCTALSTTGDWTGTLDGDNASAFARAGVNGAWQAIGTAALSPTSSVRGILVEASSTVKALVMDGNATTTGYFVIGTTQPTNNMAAGDALVGGNVTTTSRLAIGSDTNTATSTLEIGNGDATNNGCVQLETDGGVAVRAYVTISGTTPTWKLEIGTCQ